MQIRAAQRKTVPVRNILNLPVELLNIIIDCMHPSCHLNFARVNKYCLVLSNRILAQHEHCHQHAEVCSDQLPLTFPKEARMVRHDPVAAYYAHELEFWGLRPDWEQWKPYFFTDSAEPISWEHSEHYVHVNGAEAGKGGRVFPAEELQAFRAFLRRIPELSEEDWIRRIASGDEGAFKALLLAMLPRLTDLRIAEFGDGSPNQSKTPFPLPDLTELLGCSLPTSCFRHLRRVTIGIRSGLETGMSQPSSDFAFVAALFRLPSLHTLTVTVAVPYCLYEEDRIALSIPSHSSPVQHLLIDSRYHLHEWYMVEMIKGATNLKTFSLDAGSDRHCEIVDALYEHHHETLRTLDLRQFWQRSLYEVYACRSSHQNFRAFPRLQNVALELLPLLQVVAELNKHPNDSTFVADCIADETFMLDLSSILPQSTQTIDISPLDSNWVMSAHVARIVDGILSENILNRTLPNLKAVFLDAITDPDNLWHDRSDILEDLMLEPWPLASDDDSLQFPETLTAGEDRGVAIYTWSTHSVAEIIEQRLEFEWEYYVDNYNMKTDFRMDVEEFRQSAMKAAVEADDLAKSHLEE